MRVEACIINDQEMLRRVESYMEKHEMNYIPYALSKEKDGNIVVIGKKPKPDLWGEDRMFGVWTCWNDKSKTLNYGHYDLSEKAAMKYFVCPSFARERYDNRSIMYDRCIDLMTKFKDKLEETMEPYELNEFFNKECDLEEYEAKFLDLNWSHIQHYEELFYEDYIEVEEYE